MIPSTYPESIGSTGCVQRVLGWVQIQAHMSRTFSIEKESVESFKLRVWGGCKAKVWNTRCTVDVISNCPARLGGYSSACPRWACATAFVSATPLLARGRGQFEGDLRRPVNIRQLTANATLVPGIAGTHTIVEPGPFVLPDCRRTGRCACKGHHGKNR